MDRTKKSELSKEYGRRRGDASRDSQRAEILRMYVSAVPIGEIVKVMKARYGEAKWSVFKVRDEVDAIQLLWRSSALIDFNEAVGKELAKIDALESEYWEAWRRSQGDTTDVEEQEGVGAKGSISLRKTTVKQHVGDPNWLKGVAWCIERRCDLLGLDPPEQIDVNWRQQAQSIGINPGKVFDELVSRYVDALETSHAEGSLGTGATLIPETTG